MSWLNLSVTVGKVANRLQSVLNALLLSQQEKDLTLRPIEQRGDITQPRRTGSQRRPYGRPEPIASLSSSSDRVGFLWYNGFGWVGSGNGSTWLQRPLTPSGGAASPLPYSTSLMAPDEIYLALKEVYEQYTTRIYADLPETIWSPGPFVHNFSPWNLVQSVEDVENDANLAEFGPVAEQWFSTSGFEQLYQCDDYYLVDVSWREESAFETLSGNWVLPVGGKNAILVQYRSVWGGRAAWDWGMGGRITYDLEGGLLQTFAVSEDHFSYRDHGINQGADDDYAAFIVGPTGVREIPMPALVLEELRRRYGPGTAVPDQFFSGYPSINADYELGMVVFNDDDQTGYGVNSLIQAWMNDTYKVVYHTLYCPFDHLDEYFPLQSQIAGFTQSWQGNTPAAWYDLFRTPYDESLVPDWAMSPDIEVGLYADVVAGGGNPLGPFALSSALVENPQGSIALQDANSSWRQQIQFNWTLTDQDTPFPYQTIDRRFTDWGEPGLCRQLALQAGFSEADLTP